MIRDHLVEILPDGQKPEPLRSMTEQGQQTR